VLSRADLTAALAARQLLLERERLPAADAIRRLTPLQGQHPPAPFIGLAARLAGFSRGELERAIAERAVVKSSLMRQTLHLADAELYPAYAQFMRHAWMRTWRNRHPQLDERQLIGELRRWFRARPRTNEELRERIGRYEGVPDDPWARVWFARILLPLVRLPPAGFWDDDRHARFVVEPRRLPVPGTAASVVLERYLAAFGPASRRDVARWAGVPQRDFDEGFARVATVSYRDEHGVELLDLPGAPLPGGRVTLPVRFLGHWDQTLLAYENRERILPAELRELTLTITGSPTVTVDGRVAASWSWERSPGSGGGPRVRVSVDPHVGLSRAARAAIKAEGRETGRFCEPDARGVEVAGL
jgi:hypothetical protein